MTDVDVDVTRLRALAKGLREGVSALDASLARMGSTVAGQLGTESLDDACQEFQDRWRQGLEQLRESVRKVGAGLDATAASYEQYERSVCEGFQRLGASMPDPTTLGCPR